MTQVPFLLLLFASLFALTLSVRQTTIFRRAFSRSRRRHRAADQALRRGAALFLQLPAAAPAALHPLPAPAQRRLDTALPLQFLSAAEVHSQSVAGAQHPSVAGGHGP